MLANIVNELAEVNMLIAFSNVITLRKAGVGPEQIYGDREAEANDVMAGRRASRGTSVVDSGNWQLPEQCLRMENRKHSRIKITSLGMRTGKPGATRFAILQDLKTLTANLTKNGILPVLISVLCVPAEALQKV